jgi:hypothetical protein
MPTGLHTATDTGPGLIRMDGPGSGTNHGDGLLTTMVAGSTLAVAGSGVRVAITTGVEVGGDRLSSHSISTLVTTIAGTR